MDQAELARKVGKLYVDMYEGDGLENPSMTARMLAQETQRANMEDKVNKIESKIDKGFWLLLATLLSAIGTLGTVLFNLATKH